ncbi:hypothetical protein BCR36DRAFT_583712 [Piromyces finnis]|uniref:Uncharacterized protein n=1 Tax=Piromyces finnis TaxID=1754191 RepID=A0A1Y1V8G8_9FUNG|nr:hypothetical protein BCR36DRAFT_583712 [Piromyces finnis]|eukprot:ORX49642.1 hypothetical protein BCR36DRAFT_583712 [Piromyces finnis]
MNNILLPYFRTKYFDPLIYAIEKEASHKILKFIIQQYSSHLDFIIEYNYNYYDDADDDDNNSVSFNNGYTYNSNNEINNNYNNNNNNNNNDDDDDDDDDDIDDNHIDDDDLEEEATFITPLISALSMTNLDIADLLIKQGADINFEDIGHHLVENGDINMKNLNYILNHNYTVTFDFMISLIENGDNKFLKHIFKFYVFNNDIVLKFLSLSKNKIPLSNKRLNDLVLKQRYHIFVGFYWYKKAIGCHNNEALDLFIDHSISSKQIIGEFEMNGLLIKSLNSNNFYSIKKLFNLTFLDIYIIDLDNINKSITLSSLNDEELTEEDEIVMKEFIENENIVNDDSINENNASTSNSILLDSLTYFITSLINHPLFDFKKIKFEKLLSLMTGILEFYKIKFLIQKCLNHPTFNFDYVDFKKVLTILETIYNLPLTEWMIDLTYRHPTFSFKKYNFESLLTTINYYRNTDLLKFFIERSLYQETFDFEHLSIRNIFLYIGKIDDQSISEYYLNKLIGCEKFHMKYVNMNDLFITTGNIAEKSNEILDDVNQKFLNDPSFNLSSSDINIETLLKALSRIGNLYALEYYTHKILHHPTLDLQNPCTLEEILYTLCKIKNSIFVKMVMDDLFQLKKTRFTILTKVFKPTNSYFHHQTVIQSINYKKILTLAKHYRNQIIIDFIQENLNTKE